MQSIIRKLITLAVVAIAVTLVSGPAAAQDRDDSYFRITPYIWMLSLDGTTAVLGQDADLDASFSDLLDALNIALMLNMELNRGHWFFYLDPMFSSLELEFETEGALPIGGTVEADIIITDLGVGYEVSDNAGVYFGARYYDNDVTITPNLLPSVDIGDDWTDLVMGLRFTGRIGEKWSIGGKFDAAIAGDSDSALYGQIFFNRHFGENMHLDIGWRHYSVDFESGSGPTRFLWDMNHTGPAIGYSWRF